MINLLLTKRYIYTHTHDKSFSTQKKDMFLQLSVSAIAQTQ